MPPPRPLIICGPSGVGKGTIISLLTEKGTYFPPSHFGFSVSHTTRKPREGEVNGVHYHFREKEEVKRGIEDGEFVEWAEVHGNYYGTSIKLVQTVQNDNKICILDIDVQGVRSIKSGTSSTSLNPIYVFIAPPSMEALEARLRGRGTEEESSVIKRLANAKAELEYGLEEGNFDRVFVNDDLEKTCKEMAKQFVKWYPDLLGGKQQSSVAEEIPPPIVDPLSFPKTEEGLKALLNEIDRDCQLEGYSQAQLTYQATGVHIRAGKTLDIPLPPVEQDGSKVEWTVTLVDEHSERLDLEFGVVAVVDGEEVTIREMGRILSPSKVDKDEEATAATDDASSNGDENGDRTEEEIPSAKGKFTVASAPVTIVIKCDNSYSWFTPKKINYSFTIIPPVDENMIQRSLRAKSVLPRILEGKAAVAKSKAKLKERSDALDRIKSEMVEKINQLSKQVNDEKKSIDDARKRAEEAEKEASVKANEIKDVLTAVKKEEESIDSCSKQIASLEEECARLKKQWEELKIERQVRLEEKTHLETKAETCRNERIQLQEEIAAKKDEEKSKLAGLDSLEKDRALMNGNLSDLEKERSARAADEEEYNKEMSFFQRQIDAVKLRFIEPKTT
ncbi:hypothetical protein ACHAXN_003526 [Cyclotella atomus]